MNLIVKPVVTYQEKKDFVNVQFLVNKGCEGWAPPIKSDEIKALNPETNPAFEFCEAQFWVVYKNQKPVGRIGAIINKPYNEKTGENLARFSRIEFIDDQEVFDTLVETAEQWAKSKGMNGIHGPLGFTNLDTQGLLISGFDYIQSIASVYHQPYYKTYLEKAGYQKEIDWVEFRLNIDGLEIPEKVKKINEMIKSRYNLTVLSFKTNKELQAKSKEVFLMLNKAFAELNYVTPFTERMMAFYSDKYFKLLNPEFVKVLLDADKKVVGFIVGLPSLSEAMQKANGKLFPFGFIHILKALKKPTVMDLMLTGVDPELQSKGYVALLIAELQQVLINKKVGFVETTGIFENNEKAIQMWKNYDHIQHKRRRCFRKMF